MYVLRKKKENNKIFYNGPIISKGSHYKPEFPWC